MTALLLGASFVLVLGGALLFTNAIEWVGYRLNLGTGAVGSILAAVATALPESIIPIVALVGGGESGAQVAIGSIIGAPFMLATIAMSLVGLAAWGFSGSRPQDERIEAHELTLRRDLTFFLAVFGTATVLGVLGVRWLNLVFAALFVVAYVGFVAASIRRGGEPEAEHELAPLHFDWTRDDPPDRLQMALQLAAGLGAIVGGAHLFVEQLTHVSERIGVPELVLALVIAPLASELPEKINSFVWMREGKDSLALGNLTGAMAFQSSLPLSVGLVFTDWKLSSYALGACVAALVGGAIAFWAGLVRRRFGAPAILAWAGLFGAFVAYVAAGTR